MPRIIAVGVSKALPAPLSKIATGVGTFEGRREHSYVEWGADIFRDLAESDRVRRNSDYSIKSLFRNY